MPQTENIGDLLLQQLNDPQKMQQLGQMLSSLGLGGPANAQPASPNQSPGGNLSALLSSLQQQMENGSSGQNQPSQAPAGANLSALLSTLQQQMENGSKGNSAPNLSSLLLALQQGAAQNGTNSAGQAQQAQQAQQGPDLSSLLSALQGSPSGANAPAISMDTILKIQRTMQALSRSNPNIDLLRAMRPLLSPRRARKVDDAICIMQLIQLLPALKESGLFALGGDSQ